MKDLEYESFHRFLDDNKNVKFSELSLDVIFEMIEEKERNFSLNKKIKKIMNRK